MARRLNDRRGALQRRAALLLLILVVAALHGLAMDMISVRLDATAPAMPARIEVAYVRELEPAAPPAAGTRAAVVPVAHVHGGIAVQALAAASGPRAGADTSATEPPKVKKKSKEKEKAQAKVKAQEQEQEQTETQTQTQTQRQAQAQSQAQAQAQAQAHEAAVEARTAPRAGWQASDGERQAPDPDIAAEPAEATNEWKAHSADAEQRKEGDSANTAHADDAAAPRADAAAGPAAAAFVWPASTRVSYVLTGNYRGPVQGDAQVEWVHVGSRYQVHLDVTVGASFAPLITRRMTSDGELTALGLTPRRYDQETKLMFHARHHASLRFESDAIVLADGRRQPRMPGMQDSASQFIQLSYLFTTQPGLLQVGRSVELPLALPRKLERWTYDVAGEEELWTSFGPLATFHVKPRRVPQPGGDLVAEAWFAPELRYLPVRIRISQDAQTYIDLLIARKPELAAP